MSQKRIKVLLTFHTFSELVLYPWGNTYDDVGQNLGTTEDFKIFKTMAEKMATWNNYKPMQSSDLYIASGDTTDWAYGELGIYAFTFELSPKSLWGGGFYPGEGAIQSTFDDNLKPMLYLLEYSLNPNRVFQEKAPDFDVTPVKLGIGTADYKDLH